MRVFLLRLLLSLQDHDFIDATEALARTAETHGCGFENQGRLAFK